MQATRRIWASCTETTTSLTSKNNTHHQSSARSIVDTKPLHTHKLKLANMGISTRKSPNEGGWRLDLTLNNPNEPWVAQITRTLKTNKELDFIKMIRRNDQSRKLIKKEGRSSKKSKGKWRIEKEIKGVGGKPPTPLKVSLLLACRGLGSGGGVTGMEGKIWAGILCP